MAKSTISQRHAINYDALTTLKATGTAAISATTAETALAIPVVFLDQFDVVFNVSAFTGFVAGTATWTLSVEVATAAGGPWTQIGSIAPTSGSAATYLLSESGYGVSTYMPTASHIRVVATKLGTPGNLTYNAFLSSKD